MSVKQIKQSYLRKENIFQSLLTCLKIANLCQNFLMQAGCSQPWFQTVSFTKSPSTAWNEAKQSTFVLPFGNLTNLAFPKHPNLPANWQLTPEQQAKARRPHVMTGRNQEKGAVGSLYHHEDRAMTPTPDSCDLRGPSHTGPPHCYSLNHQQGRISQCTNSATQH